MCHWNVSHADFPPLDVSDLPWFWLWGLGSRRLGRGTRFGNVGKKRRIHATHAQNTQPHSLVKGGGVGTQRWSNAEIGHRMRSKLAVELRFQSRNQNNRFQNKRHLLRKEWIWLMLRVTVSRQSQVNDKTWQSLPEATFRSVSRLGEGCYAHFLVYREFTRSCRHNFVCRKSSCNLNCQSQTRPRKNRVRVSAVITHHDNQKIDRNEFFMIEDVPTSEYDDVAASQRTPSLQASGKRAQT